MGNPEGGKTGLGVIGAGNFGHGAVAREIPDGNLVRGFSLLERIRQGNGDRAAEVGDGIITGGDRQGKHQFAGVVFLMLAGNVLHFHLDLSGGLFVDALERVAVEHHLRAVIGVHCQGFSPGDQLIQIGAGRAAAVFDLGYRGRRGVASAAVSVGGGRLRRDAVRRRRGRPCSDAVRCLHRKGVSHAVCQARHRDRAAGSCPRESART
ncbi:hypothetical protein SDC9_178019 [bioreactor metagenome]|uniref:Uncharacterized protein n=1 Tax=bioreactor metagenome TaxID=1076179 RepID=A0A645GUN3_9ZZZZ